MLHCNGSLILNIRYHCIENKTQYVWQTVIDFEAHQCMDRGKIITGLAVGFAETCIKPAIPAGGSRFCVRRELKITCRGKCCNQQENPETCRRQIF